MRLKCLFPLNYYKRCDSVATKVSFEKPKKPTVCFSPCSGNKEKHKFSDTRSWIILLIIHLLLWLKLLIKTFFFIYMLILSLHNYKFLVPKYSSTWTLEFAPGLVAFLDLDYVTVYIIHINTWQMESREIAYMLHIY